MATTKKPAAGAASKPKTTAAKPAAKKPAAKAAAKPAAKKPAAKAAAKPAAKKPAAKPAAKSAVKKPAAKTAVKPAAKAAAKPAAKPAAKAAPAKKPVKSDVKFRNLFEAYAQSKLPQDQGYIISSFFDEKSFYSRYEVVSYAGVKEIFPSSSGLQFISSGKKLHVLLEPDTYPRKFLEPGNRAEDERIPKRFAELEKITAKNQTSIYISKKAEEIQGSFTVLKPQGLNFSIVFYDLPGLFATIKEFFIGTFNKQRKVPEFDAKRAADLIAKTVEKTMGFEGEYHS